MGFNHLLLLAIVAIVPTLYEAAAIDGAGKLRQIWHVTLPGIAATIIILIHLVTWKYFIIGI